jgi:hypothetical protein
MRRKVCIGDWRYDVRVVVRGVPKHFGIERVLARQLAVAAESVWVAGKSTSVRSAGQGVDIK